MSRIINDIRKFRGGGMNTDDSPEDVQSPDFIEAWNLVLTGNVEGESGDGTNLISTTEVLGYTLPAGINKCIGAQGFEQKRVAYFFIYNSFGYHQLVEFNYDNNINQLLFTDLIDTAGVQVLALNPRNYVMDIKLADGILLLFTDSNIEIGCINVERLKTGGYGVIKQNDFRLIKAQPLKVPIAVYNDDASRAVNLLKEKLFQFRNRFNYLDDEPSAFSAISKRETPTREATSSVGDDVTKNNNFIITIDIGTDRVKSLDIAARYSLYDWFIIKSVLRSYILSLPNIPIDVSNEIFERYNPTDNTYSFVFYNDGSYQNIDPTVTDQEYDFVPRKAQSLELLESNILSLAGLTEGYERPVVDVNITISNYDPELEEAPLDPNPLRVISMTDRRKSGSHERVISVTFSGIAKTNDFITAVTRDIRNAEITRGYSYEVEALYNNNTVGALLKMASIMNATPGVKGAVVLYPPATPANQYILSWVDVSYFGAAYANVKNASIGSGLLSSIQSLKMNSAYQLMLQHYDQYGRVIPGNTGDEYTFKTSSYAQNKGLVPVINWQILSPPPADAASAQWLLSENTTHQKTLYINAKYLRTDGEYIVMSINPLKIYNERNKSSILNYEYSEGDRATFNYYVDGSTKIYFDNPFIDVQVVGFDIVVNTAPDPDTITWELKLRLNASLDVGAITDKNVYIEIYTPKKRVVTDGDTTTYLTNLFYEVGEQISITNGAYDVTSGTITDGDVYFQTRDYVSAVDETTYSTYLAEDFNFSTLYTSNFNSYGRGFLFNERDGIKERKGGMRYSDKKLINTNFNMLNRFFGERLYGDGDGETSSTFGWIRKIRLRDNYLVVLQEVKVGHVPVFNTIVEDQVGQNQAFLSDKLFNKVRYSQTGKRGMGNARECFSESPNGTMYFIDPNNSVPMREGYDGLVEISGKMSKFFKKTFQLAKQLGRDIISVWDNYTKRVFYSIQVPADEVVQVPINATYLDYQEDYIVDKTDITISVQPTKGVVSFIGDEWVFTPTVGESGSDSFIISFDVDGDTILKPVCVTIEAGAEAPVEYLFNDVIDADINTLYTSNFVLITGITNPLPFNVVGGEYSFDGVSWFTGGGLVVNDSTIQVRRSSSTLYSTTVSVTLTVGTYSDSFDITTKTPVMVDVDYSIVFGTDPYVSNGLLFTRNGDEVFRSVAESTGTLTGVFFEGDLIGIRQISYVDVFPWPPLSNANLKIDESGVEVYNGDVTVQVTELQSDSFTIPFGSTGVAAFSTGSSTAVGYLTHTLTTNNDFSAVVGDCGVSINDNTDTSLVIDVEPEAGTSAFNFNVLDNADLMTVTFYNNMEGVTLRVFGTGVSGYTFDETVAAATNVVLNNVPKGSVVATFEVAP